MSDSVSPRQFLESEGAEDWRLLNDGAYATFRTGSFGAGARLVQAISELPDIEHHHPDVDVRYDAVTVRLITITSDSYGMTRRDLELARRTRLRPESWACLRTPRGSRACWLFQAL